MLQNELHLVPLLTVQIMGSALSPPGLCTGTREDPHPDWLQGHGDALQVRVLSGVSSLVDNDYVSHTIWSSLDE